MRRVLGAFEGELEPLHNPCCLRPLRCSEHRVVEASLARQGFPVDFVPLGVGVEDLAERGLRVLDLQLAESPRGRAEPPLDSRLPWMPEVMTGLPRASAMIPVHVCEPRSPPPVAMTSFSPGDACSMISAIRANRRATASMAARNISTGVVLIESPAIVPLASSPIPAHARLPAAAGR